MARKIGLECPRCSEGQVVERRAKEGERLFYGCHRFPHCDFVSAKKPIAGKCPECSSPYLVERILKSGARWAECPDKKCGWKRKLA